MQNIIINKCEKFHDDRSRNDLALGDRKSDNNKNTQKRTTFVRLGTRFRVKKQQKTTVVTYTVQQSNSNTMRDHNYFY